MRGWFGFVVIRVIELVLAKQNLSHAQPVDRSRRRGATQITGGEPLDHLFKEVAGSNQ